MKLTIEFSITELQKVLQAIAGSQEHENIWTTDQPTNLWQKLLSN